MMKKVLEKVKLSSESIALEKKSFFWLAKWIIIGLLTAIFSGSASAFFLVSLEKVTLIRENKPLIIIFLPLSGVLIVWLYDKFGKNSYKGNNLILEEIQSPKSIVPFVMAPLVLLGTLITHLFGGSAGREGTAVQMGAAIADRFSGWLKLDNDERPILLICGISAGFASVFGTPLAGAVFALEVFTVGRLNYKAIFPSFFTAIVASHIVDLWEVSHTHYTVSLVPDFNLNVLVSIVILGIAFGFSARLFSNMSQLFNNLLSKIKLPTARALVGGGVVASIFLISGSQRYAGLGIPIIQESFDQTMPWYDFVMKTIFTTFTLSSGFKGGEVTPLFFTGATLGSFLSQFVNLPIALAAGMGFVAVFSGATNTPLACTLMSIELFGAEPAIFCGLACVVAYIFSGKSSIYTSQILPQSKIKVDNY